jgi:molybdopterin-guanine dinucleotide biosynthesis protein A
MGTDKALLPMRGRTLVQHVAATVQAAAGSVILIGDPAKYRDLGYRVLPDAVAGCGPLGGIVTALDASTVTWNLVLACDLPRVNVDFLSRLLARAEQSDLDCVIPVGPSGRAETLCAAYHGRCHPVLHEALASGVRKILDGVGGLRVDFWHTEAAVFHNLNTPEDWQTYTAGQYE